MDNIYIIFDGPPSHDSGRFVEVENARGNGLGPEQTGADWKQREDKLWSLGPFYSAAHVEAEGSKSYDAGLEDGESDGMHNGAEPLLNVLDAIQSACPQRHSDRRRLDADDWMKIADSMYDLAGKAARS